MIKALVAVLTLTIVVMMGFVVWGVFRQAEKMTLEDEPQTTDLISTGSSRSAGQKQRETVPVLAGYKEMALDIPVGCRVEAAEPLGDRYLALRIEGSLAKGCKQILVMDLVTGESRRRLTLPAKPKKVGTN